MAERDLPDVFVDLGGQREYLERHSRDACHNAAHVCEAVKQLFAFARWSRTPVLSCIDHVSMPPGADLTGLRNGHLTPEQHKAAFTLLPQRAVVHLDNQPCVSLRIFENHRQVIMTKTHCDPFTNPKLDRLLTELPVRRFIIFGTPVETSLRILALGLLQRSRSVVVIRDACGFWDEETALMTLRKLDVKGCQVIPTADFLADEVRRRNSRRPPRPRRRSVA